MKKESPLWSSISLLIGIVIAILALIRGRMLLPLLLAVFALWLLWWLLTQALPLWRNNRAYADGFVAQIKDINAQRAQAGAAASSIIGDGDASHLELPDNGAHFALGAVIDGEREELPA